MEYYDDNTCDSSLEKPGLVGESSEDESILEDSTNTDDIIERRRIAKINLKHNTKNPFLCLPRDVLLNIMKWIISSRLDVVSLARVSLVCKALYNISHDDSLWHSMCEKVWGSTVVRKPYLTWRDHFISRPHLHIHGVYVSKTSYIRTGDVSMSLTSRPYYLVEYYRILRFFPNGEILMLTTPQDPREVVHKLESKNKKVQGLLLGKYVLVEDQCGGTVHATLTKYYVSKDASRFQQSRSRRQNRSEPPTSISEYRIELKLSSTSSRKKFNKLTWIHHSCCTRYEKSDNGNTCVFDLTKQYPALNFHGVKSFTAESFKPV